MRHRLTKQRELVFQTVQKLDHPTAEQVYDEILKFYPSVGRATVFRNLLVLTEENFLLRLSFSGKPTRYDANIYRHDHFICEKCGKIIDLAANETIPPPVGKDFVIRSQSVYFYGLCRECIDKHPEV